MTVNLIPIEMRLGSIRKRRMRIWIGLCVLALITMLIRTGWIYWQYRDLSNQVERVTAEYENTLSDIDALRQARSDLDRWKGKIALLQELKFYPNLAGIGRILSEITPRDIYYSHLELGGPTEQTMGTLPSAIPAGMEMFQLKQKSDADQASENEPQRSEHIHILALDGYAMNHSQLAELMENLKKTGLFKIVEMKRVQRRNSSMTSQLEFEIRCTLEQDNLKQELDYADLRPTQTL